MSEQIEASDIREGREKNEELQRLYSEWDEAQANLLKVAELVMHEGGKFWDKRVTDAKKLADEKFNNVTKFAQELKNSGKI
jgi:hypothetical protein